MFATLHCIVTYKLRLLELIGVSNKHNKREFEESGTRSVSPPPQMYPKPKNTITLSVQGCWWVLIPTRNETSYTDRRFWFSYILFIIGGILVQFIYITILASNEIFQPSNKIHREVGRAKDFSASLVVVWAWNSTHLEKERNLKRYLRIKFEEK
jgi:hypothetical protein